MVWQDTLRIVLEHAYDSLEKKHTAWTVVGSTATALQGCQVQPHDLDLLTRYSQSVFDFAERLAPFAATESTGSFFLSTPDVPVFVGPMGNTEWHFGRWMIGGIFVEVAHIAPPEGWTNSPGDGIWECGPAIWPHICQVCFEQYSIPVVPLEIQVETNLARERTEHGENLLDRVQEITRIFHRNGYDRMLLEQVLGTAHLARFDEIMCTE